jgi:tRNA A22 N-methylase
MAQMINIIKTNFEKIVETAFNTNDVKKINALVGVYNTYQENERDFVDYIYDYNNADDLCSCIKGGMGILHITRMFNESKKFAQLTSYFLLTQNGDTILLSQGVLASQLKSHSEEIAENMLCYPHSYNKEMYWEIVTGILEEKMQNNC